MFGTRVSRSGPATDARARGFLLGEASWVDDPDLHEVATKAVDAQPLSVPVSMHRGPRRTRRTVRTLIGAVLLLVLASAGIGVFLWMRRPNISFAWDVIVQREPMPIGPATSDQVRGKAHVRITKERGIITKVEWVGPVDNVMRTVTFQTDGQGTLTTAYQECTRYRHQNRAADSRRAGDLPL